MNYSTIIRKVDETFIEKKSKFIAYTFPILNETVFKKTLIEIKELHPKANHHCWAYILEDSGEIEKCSDDGEPSGAAGLPILGQLKSKKLTYCACIVVRYFGGIKLGKGGMIKAYKEAARQSIECASVIEKDICINYIIKIKYSHMDRIMQLIKRDNILINRKEISEICIFDIEIPLNIADRIDKKLNDMCADFDRDLPT